MAKLHSGYVKESESNILERSNILPPTPQPAKYGLMIPFLPITYNTVTLSWLSG